MYIYIHIYLFVYLFFIYLSIYLFIYLCEYEYIYIYIVFFKDSHRGINAHKPDIVPFFDRVFIWFGVPLTSRSRQADHSKSSANAAISSKHQLAAWWVRDGYMTLTYIPTPHDWFGTWYIQQPAILQRWKKCATTMVRMIFTYIHLICPSFHFCSYILELLYVCSCAISLLSASLL